MAEWAGGGGIDWRLTDGFKAIKSNIVGWGLMSEVPDFGKYVQDYWMADVEKILSGEAECEGVVQETIFDDDGVIKDYERLFDLPVLVKIYGYQKSLTEMQGYIFLCKDGFWRRINRADCGDLWRSISNQTNSHWRRLLVCEGNEYAGTIH
jgi:hypothetical protein